MPTLDTIINGLREERRKLLNQRNEARDELRKIRKALKVGEDDDLVVMAQRTMAQAEKWEDAYEQMPISESVDYAQETD